MMKKPLSLTEGSIAGGMLRFALPLFLANLFQQLYNTADTFIVGRYLGETALAAVGSSGSLILLLVGFFQGLFVGAGVVTARCFGAGNRDELRRSVHTTVVFGLLCGLTLTAVGLVFTSSILHLMKTPPTVLPESIRYFRLYFCGSIALVMYNSLTGILQAVGDSRHPLFYLIFSSLLNILLDWLLIGVIGFGVGAAAVATAVSQLASAALCFRRLLTKVPEEYRISLRELKIDLTMLRRITANGVPTGGQTSIISVANVFVQSNINSFGAIAVAGCAIYSRLEGFFFLPVTAFSMALTTCISQNLGAAKYDRVKKCGIFGIAVGSCLAELIGLAALFTMPYIAGAFSSDHAVTAFTLRQARVCLPCFMLCAYSHCISGLLRGAGKSAVPMYIMLLFWCLVRVLFISIMVRLAGEIESVFLAYPLTWSLSSIVFTFFLLKTDWIHGYPSKTHTV